MRTLVWFRADLRVHDHPALHHAVRESGGEVVAIFVLSPEQWQEHDWSGVKVNFILRHLRELSKSLSDLGIPLLIASTPRFEGHADILLTAARKHRCEAVYFNREYELNELRRDAAVESLLSARGMTVRGFDDQCVIRPGELRTGEGKFYTVFTPFKKAMCKLLVERGGAPPPLPKPPKLAHSQASIKSDTIPTSVQGFNTSIPPELWPAGEAVALTRLRSFIESRARSYKTDRNFPAIDATSSLSPYLTVGSITTRQCMHAAAEANGGRLDGGNEGLATWISELIWRDFYRHVLIGFPRVCMHRAFKPMTDRIRWNDDDEAFAAWCEGRTGVPIVDAGMRQLAATGWMHNRVRMIVAMYLTKDLFIDWRRGEKHFMRHLVDGDLASNNGGWQWSASTGTDAAPYFRIFNPITQSQKFDTSGEYIRRWVPELTSLDGGEKGPIHDPSVLVPLARIRVNYPSPRVDRREVKDRVMRAFQALPAR